MTNPSAMTSSSALSALAMTPVTGPVVGAIRPPGSKSLTNRALVLGGLAPEPTTLTGVLDSDDTRVMIAALRTLGLSIQQDLDARTISFAGRHGWPTGETANLWLENSGTSIRFLTAYCALAPEGVVCRLDGNTRMRERPIQPLVDALTRWGADVSCDLGTGCPPVTVVGKGLPGGRVTVSGSLSSQYLSALMMVAPCASGPESVTLTVEGTLVSRPYVDMTLAIMRDFGASIDEPVENQFVIAPTGYQGREYAIEPDASAASYFFAAAAVTGGKITVKGLHRDSLQGDVLFAEALERMGCRVDWNPDSITVHGGPLRGIEIDMNAISDTAQTLAAVAPFADGPTRITNVAHMRHKETDRVGAVVTELRKLGLTVDEHDDGMTIHPGPMSGASIATYDDHRMAMSFAILGLRQPGIIIEHPGCTSKTYPNFFADLGRLCGGEQ
ncbi:MAG: 3-phosphoshikimate 1-carboxyvinyltransferase [Planctomycetaceae bacterium]